MDKIDGKKEGGKPPPSGRMYQKKILQFCFLKSTNLSQSDGTQTSGKDATSVRKVILDTFSSTYVIPDCHISNVHCKLYA